MDNGADGGEGSGDAAGDGESSLNLLHARKMPESMLSAFQTAYHSQFTDALFLHTKALKHNTLVNLPMTSSRGS